MQIPIDSLDGVTAFVLAVDSGSFAAAAARLGQTRSAVAKRIARLEARLGQRLLQRSTRQLHLTEPGALYFDACRRALADLEQASAALQSGRDQPQGRLRVSAPVLFGRLCVAPALLTLCRQHPQLQLDLQFNNRIVDLLDEGFDLAVRFGELRDSSQLAARRLAEQQFVLVAADGLFAPAEHGGSFEALQALPRIVYSNDRLLPDWPLLDPRGQPRLLRSDAALRCNDVQLMVDAALAGAGIARLPYWLVRSALESGRLRRLLPDWQIHREPIHAVWPAQRPLPAKTRMAIDALLRQAAALGIDGPLPVGAAHSADARAGR